MSLPPRDGLSAVDWNGGVFAAAAIVAPALAVVAPLGMAPLLIAAALAILLADAARGRGLPRDLIDAWRASRALRDFALLGGLLCAWALASSAWAVDRAQAIGAAGQVFGVLVAAIVCLAGGRRLSGSSRRVIVTTLIIGVVLALAVLAAERLSDGWLAGRLRALDAAGPDQIFSRYNRGLTVVLLLAFAALLALRGRFVRLALGIVVLAVVMTYFGSSLQMAAYAATLAIGLTLCLPRLMPWMIGATIALFVAAAPLLPPLTLQTVDTDAITTRTQNVSIAHRVIIWRFSAERIAERPFTGWGMNAARAMPGGKEKVLLIPGPSPIYGEQMPLHTHNAPLQWWLELGVPGAVLMAGLWLLALVRVVQIFPARMPRAIAVGAFTAAFVIANLSYGAWQAWWLSTLVFAALFLSVAMRRARDVAS
jgi:exopolysaccharide production protein ExoQ